MLFIPIYSYLILLDSVAPLTSYINSNIPSQDSLFFLTLEGCDKNAACHVSKRSAKSSVLKTPVMKYLQLQSTDS